MSAKHLVPTLLVFALLCPVASSRGDGIPEAARKHMNSLVGTWNCEAHIGGEVIKDVLIAKWSENKDAVVLHWKGKGIVTGNEASTTGIIGWDGRKNVLFEAAVGSTGEGFTATHSIASDQWESPTKTTHLINGKFLRETSLRVFKWNSPKELSMVVKNRIMKGEDQPEFSVIFQRAD